eukprot:CAMPEP_0172417748 /NCGR_PEP_ID=MMETSP1064-20121228/4247_1 /TAXON_ID=202472 /ORGANISM="Aulacoseira subarctica , Strain CCAP 1002/5" /LENGTH=518 /DNA_ID=CAMNT_0013156245 /DNA_START=41 /DNA_END=1597 /DNA_ORIENTATION=+
MAPVPLKPFNNVIIETTSSTSSSDSSRKLEQSKESLPFKKRRCNYERETEVRSTLSTSGCWMETKIHSGKESSITKEEISTPTNQKTGYLYIDRADETDDDPLTPLTPFGTTPNFPAKMYAILANTTFKSSVEWLPHGRSWRILNQKSFEQSILPTFFGHFKFASFLRQAHGWGFLRIQGGPDKDTFYHEYFLRGLPHLCKKLTRPRRPTKPSVDPSDTPDFQNLTPLPTDPVPDESVLLLSTIRNGPKAKVPVSFNLYNSQSIDAEVTSVSTDAQPVPMTREMLDSLIPRSHVHASHTSDSSFRRVVNPVPSDHQTLPMIREILESLITRNEVNASHTSDGGIHNNGSTRVASPVPPSHQTLPMTREILDSLIARDDAYASHTSDERFGPTRVASSAPSNHQPMLITRELLDTLLPRKYDNATIPTRLANPVPSNHSAMPMIRDMLVSLLTRPNSDSQRTDIELGNLLSTIATGLPLNPQDVVLPSFFTNQQSPLESFINSMRQFSNPEKGQFSNIR